MWIAELFKGLSADLQLPQRQPEWILFGIAALMAGITLNMVI